MRYDIRLRVGYRYGQPVNSARHLLRVRPRGDRGQTVESLSLTFSPQPFEAVREADFFGNATDHLRLTGAHDAFTAEMRARVRVERRAPAPAPGLAAIAQEARTVRDAEGASPVHHLGPSRLVTPDRAITAYARGATQGHLDGADAALALARGIREDFAYVAGSTDVSTSVASVFSQRRGVCQDFAHVMIAALRGLGVPAAYVSGFLRTEPPPGMARLEGADAMHAWVDVWLGTSVGWVGFDPTNGCMAVGDHVIAAIGRDYADVAPVDGVVTTTGAQSAWHTVDIVPLD
ncbi:transglutaminase family protein [Aureimonas mangrovi]|uniref:transglutaminase family protein n=1 Tax=Aureimonas mangrovi TaxID=2758041 RepID=UPI00163D6B42|nr:transglutaminase family protein [Aureimonas mangrovi]